MRCPVCKKENRANRDPDTGRKTEQKYGSYRRKSDSRVMQRYKCLVCDKTYSTAINDPAYNQKKRRINYPLKCAFASLMSMRRAAILFGVTRKTVARKLAFLGKCCTEENKRFLLHYTESVQTIQFDELQTIEHTKCKPLSVAVAVSAEDRKILGFSVSTMPATGHLSKLSRKKYGHRPDHRRRGLRELFSAIQPVVSSKTTFHSDQHPYYRSLVSRFFPESIYYQSKGCKSSVTGQGELKKTRRDPLFFINHTLAMLRANIHRLLRKTWCTTKDPVRLIDHLAIYISVHNSLLTA